MKKARNIEEAYGVFETQRPLDLEHAEFYVDLFQDTIDNLSIDLKFNQEPNKTLFVTGQVGNGKSTALNFLANSNKISKYELIYVNGRELFKPNDTDIIDVLLSIAFAILDKDNKKIIGLKIADDLREFKNVVEELLVKEEQETSKDNIGGEVSFFAKAKAALPIFSFGSESKAKYSAEVETKTVIRKMYKPQIGKLLELLNTTIDRYISEYSPTKRVLLIVDDLEKMTNKTQIEELFGHYGFVFSKINCVKILTFPIYLTTAVDYLNNDAYKFSLRISANKLEESELLEDETAKKTREKLRKLIFARLDENYQNLISAVAADEAISKSGANPRQLMEILQKSARFAAKRDGDTIEPMDIEKAVSELQNARSGAIHKILSLLSYIKTNNKAPEKYDNETDFFDSLKTNYVFVYFNGTPWYEINPIIEKTLSVYSREER